MRVVFLEDVMGVAQGGDVKEVKNGFARNYLIPQNLAVPATHNALKRIERLTKESDVVRLKTLTDMKVLAEEIDGTQVNVEMKAGANGRLYGSVTNAVVADKLTEITEREIDRKTVLMSEPLRELGTFDVKLRLHPEVEATINILVYAEGTEPGGEDESAEDEEAAVAPESEAALTEETPSDSETEEDEEES
jgi:large subunit ribosomal protein L9